MTAVFFLTLCYIKVFAACILLIITAPVKNTNAYKLPSIQLLQKNTHNQTNSLENSYRQS